MCFLSCNQVSQESGKGVWYSHLLKNFPVCCDPHKVFSVINEADVLLEFPCFSYDPTDVGNLISGPCAFSKSSLHIWKLPVHVLLKPSLKDFEHHLARMRNEYNCMVVWTFFRIAFGTGIKTQYVFPFIQVFKFFIRVLQFIDAVFTGFWWGEGRATLNGIAAFLILNSNCSFFKYWIT